MLLLSVLLGGGLLALATYNLRVNPYGAYGSGASDRYAAFRGDVSSRIFKAERLREGWQALILGSSRAQLGISPRHPDWGTQRVYNAALRGGRMVEIFHALRLAAEQPGLSRVVLFVDFFAFSRRGRINFDFEFSRLNPELDPIEYHLGNLLGLNGTRESLRVRERARSGKPSLLDARGRQRVLPAKKAGTRHAFDKVLGNFFEKPELFGAYELGSEQLESFRALVALCRDRGIALSVAVSPVHATLLQAIRLRGLWPVYEDWKRELTAALAASDAPLLDFTAFDGPTGEPLHGPDGSPQRTRWFRDASHFGPELGDRVLAAVLASGSAASGSAPALGRRLSDANLKAHLASLRREREAWALRQPADLRFVQAVHARVVEHGVPAR